MTEPTVESIQRAFDQRCAIYLKKMQESSPFAEDDCNRHERFSFVLECFDMLAYDAGLTMPAEVAEAIEGWCEPDRAVAGVPPKA